MPTDGNPRFGYYDGQIDTDDGESIVTVSGVRFPHREPVDFAIIGSGAAGGVLARELSTAGFDVVVLEQGAYRRAEDFTHDELSVVVRHEISSGASGTWPQTFRSAADEKSTVPDFPAAYYATTVGGSSVHFSGNYWRLRPVDFDERTRLGTHSGNGLR